MPCPRIAGFQLSTEARNLKAGGRFVGYQLNYDLSRAPHYYDKYCFNVRIAEEEADGQPFVFSVTVGEYTSPDITSHYWSKKSLESTLAAVCFSLLLALLLAAGMLVS